MGKKFLVLVSCALLASVFACYGNSFGDVITMPGQCPEWLPLPLVAARTQPLLSTDEIIARLSDAQSEGAIAARNPLTGQVVIVRGVPLSPKAQKARMAQGLQAVLLAFAKQKINPIWPIYTKNPAHVTVDQIFVAEVPVWNVWVYNNQATRSVLSFSCDEV